jgi:hypothetical protein
MGEEGKDGLRVNFDRRLTLEFHISVHAEHDAFLYHCEGTRLAGVQAFRPKKSQKTSGFRLLRFARNDPNAVFP